MKVTLTRKDALDLLLALEERVRAGGDVASAVAIELGRASIKRVTELKEIRYVDSYTKVYMDVAIEPENNDPKFPPSEKD